MFPATCRAIIISVCIRRRAAPAESAVYGRKYSIPVIGLRGFSHDRCPVSGSVSTLFDICRSTPRRPPRSTPGRRWSARRRTPVHIAATTTQNDRCARVLKRPADGLPRQEEVNKKTKKIVIYFRLSWINGRPDGIPRATTPE